MFPLGAPIPPTWSAMSRLHFHRRPEPEDPRAWNLTLVSANTGVPLRLAAESPTLLTAAVEDLCWRLALEDLEKRRPRWWQRRARAAWRDELARMEAERCRIVEMTACAVSEL